MKESALNRDEKTGGLSGMAERLDGILPTAPATPTALTGVKLPAKLVGVRLEAGAAVGLSLPNLADREVVTAWRSVLRGSPIYVRCVDRKHPISVAFIQRLSRMGELWLDGAVPDDGAALDFLVAGAHRLIIWPDEVDDAGDFLDSLGDSAVLGWSGAPGSESVFELAKTHMVPVLAAVDLRAPTGLDVYRVDLTASGRYELHRIETATTAPPESPTGEVDDGTTGDDTDDDPTAEVGDEKFGAR